MADKLYDDVQVESKNSKKNKKEKKPNIFVRMGRKIKEIFSELKKVSWPTFVKVVKNTGIVLVVVLIFLVVITAFDFGLTELLRLVSPASTESTALSVITNLFSL